MWSLFSTTDAMLPERRCLCRQPKIIGVPTIVAVQHQATRKSCHHQNRKMGGATSLTCHTPPQRESSTVAKPISLEKVLPPVQVVGFSVALRCVWDFGWTGHGTPAPVAPPKKLVVGGFYRHVRNPMHVGFAVGWSTLIQQPSLR